MAEIGSGGHTLQVKGLDLVKIALLTPVGLPGCDQHRSRRESGVGDQQDKPKYTGPPELKEMVLSKGMLEGGKERRLHPSLCLSGLSFLNIPWKPSTYKHCPCHLRHQESPRTGFGLMLG